MRDVVSFIIENWETIVGLILGVITLVKATRWGAANARALETVSRVIEASNAHGIKREIATQSVLLPPAAQDAIQDAVSIVDPKKTATTPFQKFIRELSRRK